LSSHWFAVFPMRIQDEYLTSFCKDLRREASDSNELGSAVFQPDCMLVAVTFPQGGINNLKKKLIPTTLFIRNFQSSTAGVIKMIVIKRVSKNSGVNFFHREILQPPTDSQAIAKNPNCWSMWESIPDCE
jgi:hypothetical protein